MTKIKGENQPLEWSDYKSMTFTQCVMIPMPLYSQIGFYIMRKNAIPPHFVTIIFYHSGIFHIVIRDDISTGDK